MRGPEEGGLVGTKTSWKRVGILELITVQVVVELILQERPWAQVLNALNYHFKECRPVEAATVSNPSDRPNSLGVMHPSYPWVLVTPLPLIFLSSIPSTDKERYEGFGGTGKFLPACEAAVRGP